MLFKENKWIINTSSFLLVLLFVYTGTSKLLDHQQFMEQLSYVSYLKAIAAPLSICLPLLELITGLAITYKPTQSYGLYAAAILMTIFAAYVGLMLLSDKTKLPCSCGGVIKAMSWNQHLYFNIFFMLLGWLTIKLRASQKRE